ncbi:MAG TPA: S9 family peptidase [Chitinophagaceae bacterium]|nr:S9 family peptidase [Chitinophagaceae bacterium]
MKSRLLFVAFMVLSSFLFAQNLMTPETLWSLGRVSGKGISKAGNDVVYSVSTPNITENKSSSKTYVMALEGGTPGVITSTAEFLNNPKISPDGKYLLTTSEVKVKPVTGSDFYPELTKSNALIYDQLNYRHWDEWEDGKYNHVMLQPLVNGVANGDPIDLMKDEPYDSPLKPFGGDEDYVWSPDGKTVVYAAKKKYGTSYAVSTNTDLYAYDLATGKTTNLSEANKGYDVNPRFNTAGQLAWLQMKRDGYEADKQDLVVMNMSNKSVMNLTAQRDDIHVESYAWASDGKSLFFTAPINGTMQLFNVIYPGLTRIAPAIRQVTKGDFDVTAVIGQNGNTLVVARNDMNHATELYTVDIASGNMKQLTHVNDDAYAKIGMVKTERRFVKTIDGKQMLVWVVYPPNFDKNKKYPTLLYCQGGPQSPLTQFYSFRWNLQLMASNGYIIVAPNRRGMPGHGTKWNEQISKDHGGIVMQDYLYAIDALSKEPFVDKNRLGCVGASYGGYSVFMLAGIHKNRFKTFIAHDGIFDFRSMYGSTEELFFVDWDYGGSYWDTKNLAAQKSYKEFNPSNFVANWNTPILIYHGAKDYRVPLEQGMQAFQAAQLRGIKSKFIVLPDENHWVLHAQTALVWQKEFYKWLDETLK